MAPLLRHVLTLQAKALQRFGNDRIARPVFSNLRLQRLDRLQGMTIDDGRADVTDDVIRRRNGGVRSEEHTSELQSLMRISYAVFCLKKKKHKTSEAAKNIV